jgi:dephospho-CoA kinase
VLIVALTGGIGSGKSAASELFAQRGVPVIDTDHIARELVEPGQPALRAIADTFGREVLRADGSLDRRRLRERVFADPEQRRRLEAILHPRIQDEVTRRVAELDVPYCIVVVPLLMESGTGYAVDRILVVDVPPEIQLERTRARDGISDAQARAILAAQASRAERLAVADDIIDNAGSLEALESQVQALHSKYRELGDRPKHSG